MKTIKDDRPSIYSFSAKGELMNKSSLDDGARLRRARRGRRTILASGLSDGIRLKLKIARVGKRGPPRGGPLFSLRAFFIAAAVIGSGLASSASSIAGDGPAPLTAAEIRREHEEYARMFDVLLARTKAEIRLTHDQENNWRRFEAAVHSATESYWDAMMETLARLKVGEKPSPIEHVRAIADHMAKGSDQVKSMADAAEPLFKSLSVEQKGKFGRLLQLLVERFPHAGAGLHPGAGLHRWGHDKVGDSG